MSRIVCRFCACSTVRTASVALFSDEAKSTRLSGRLSTIIGLPVADSDGLSQHMCRPCNRKFSVAETFRELARSTYDCTSDLPTHGSVTVNARKRTTNTSCLHASPHTQRARPAAKRTTTGTAGRRLPFTSGKH